MKRIPWRVSIGIMLIGLSAALYVVHYFIFGDFSHIARWTATSFAFLPISALVVSRTIKKHEYNPEGINLYALKEQYPYLFSLAVRTNPFDRDASAVVT